MKRSLALLFLVVVSAAMTAPVDAAPWVKGYVAGSYSFAFRYGGRADYARGAEIEPGIDCPHGNTTFFANPGSVRSVLSLVPWQNNSDIESLAFPRAQDQKRPPPWLDRPYAASYRGYRKDIETYLNPFAANDPGEPEVVSRIAEGFNLDGKVKSSDFVSPDGEAGIDNNLYRAWGCDAPWRGNGNATLDLRANDKMQEGLYTVVIRLSGNQSPMNDDAATLEIGYSPDKIVKDATGKTGADYSYRLLKSAQYTRLKAHIKDGVVETEQADIHMPQIAWFYNQTRDADFHSGKIRIVPNRDGTARGLIGGYRAWRDLYIQNTFGQGGSQQGQREHEDNLALYFALRRNADGLFNAKTGRNDGISTAYDLSLVPAFVVDPQKPMEIPILAGDLRARRDFDRTAAAMIRGTDTLVPQIPEPGSVEWEPGVGRLGIEAYRKEHADEPLK